MTRFILSIIFCIGAGSALAQAAAPRHSDALHAQAGSATLAQSTADAQPKIVQAALVMPTNNQPMRVAGMPSTAQDTSAAVSPAAAQEEHPTTSMLLAALALMLGIALRRWSLGDR